MQEISSEESSKPVAQPNELPSGVQAQIKAAVDIQKPTLASFVGDEMAKNITAISGEKGADALTRSFQAADKQDNAARIQEFRTFAHETIVHLAAVGKGDKAAEQTMLDAAAGLDKEAKSTGSYTAMQALKQAFDGRDGDNVESSRAGMTAFLDRTNGILKEAYQDHFQGMPSTLRKGQSAMSK